MDRSTTSNRKTQQTDSAPRESQAEWLARLDRALDQLRGPGRVPSDAAR